MSLGTQLHLDGHTLYLKGVLDHHSVAQLYPLGAAWLQQQTQPAVVDLTGVSQSNSAGLSLLLHWLRVAKQHQTSLTFKALPLQMASLMTVHGLQDIFSGYQN